MFWRIVPATSNILSATIIGIGLIVSVDVNLENIVTVVASIDDWVTSDSSETEDAPVNWRIKLPYFCATKLINPVARPVTGLTISLSCIHLNKSLIYVEAESQKFL